MATAIAEANKFLAPVLDRTQLLSLRNASLIQRLSSSLPSPPSSTGTKPLTRAVIRHALSLLKSIHATASSQSRTAEKLVNTTDVRTVICLLDLLVLEGVYPSLSHGVGIPLERRARNFVLPATAAAARKQGKVQEIEENRDVELLEEVVGGLIGIIKESSDGVGRTGRERCLVDLLAGCGELAFVEDGVGAAEWKEVWGNLIESTPTPALLPSLLSLLHPLTPFSFRKLLTSTLSTLPLRPNAIRHILQLFLSTVPDSALSVDALTNASRIICAVPTSITLEEYFAKVCPQLLECLDGNDAGLVRAAGFMISELLGKKGKVEAIIQREIVKPIISELDPTRLENEKTTVKPIDKDRRKASSALLAFENTTPPAPRNSLIQEITSHSPSLASEIADNTQEALPLVSEQGLSKTLHRLSTLLSSHPSPSVPQRLLSPLLLPLWALTSYAKQTSRSTWHTRASSLLRSYLKTSVATDSENVLSRLQHSLLFTGGPAWEFGPGAEGGIEIRHRSPGSGRLGMDAIEARVEDFLALLDEVPEGALNMFFLSILRVWLRRRNDEEEGDPVGMFTTSKVLQEMLSRHSEVLAKAPTQTLQIVGGVLAEYVDYRESLKKQREQVVNPTMGGLGKIVQGVSMPRKQQGGDEDEEDQDEETERDETVMMALSLLSVLVSQPGTKLTEEDKRLIQTLHPPLRYLSTSSGIDEDLSSLAVNIASLLSLHEPTTTSSSVSSLAEEQKASYVLALSYLRDPLIPVRAHGLHLLRELILSRAAVVDVVGTMRLLIGMLKDGDSFVYLNVVKCLSALTERHSKTVTKMLVESYIDDVDALALQEEGARGGRLGLDERLRIGEALLGTVQRLGGALVGETAEVIGQGMLGIISRRRVRESSEGDRGEDWDSGPEDEEGDDGVNDDPEIQEKKKAERAHKARIIKGWHPKNSTEDLRIRTSALSILGAAIETNASGLGPRILTESLSTSLSILTLETVAEKAILRRAAVVCIGSVLKSLVGLNDDEKEDQGAWKVAVWDVVKGRVGEVRRVLGYVRISDNDGLVREQAGVVGENLEAVIERWMLDGGGGSGDGGGSGVGGMGRIVEIRGVGLGD